MEGHELNSRRIAYKAFQLEEFDIQFTLGVMLSFMESPGDHRSWLIEVTTRSMLGRDLLKIVRPPGRKLVTTQPRTVKRYNKIVEDRWAGCGSDCSRSDDWLRSNVPETPLPLPPWTLKWYTNIQINSLKPKVLQKWQCCRDGDELWLWIPREQTWTKVL